MKFLKADIERIINHLAYSFFEEHTRCLKNPLGKQCYPSLRKFPALFSIQRAPNTHEMKHFRVVMGFLRLALAQGAKLKDFEAMDLLARRNLHTPLSQWIISEYRRQNQ